MVLCLASNTSSVWGGGLPPRGSSGRSVSRLKADALMPDALTGHRMVWRTVQLISHAHGIQHAPEDVEFELKNIQHALLGFSRLVVLERDAQAMLDVAARFLQAFAEVAVTGRIDPAVVLWPRVQTGLVNRRGEQLGE